MDRPSSSTVQCTYNNARLPEQRLKPPVFCIHSIKKCRELTDLYDIHSYADRDYRLQYPNLLMNYIFSGRYFAFRFSYSCMLTACL